MSDTIGSTDRVPVPHSNRQHTRRARRGTTEPERADPDGGLHDLPRAPNRELKETAVVLADLLLIVPAALAGIGGVLLGDRVGLRIKTALAERRRG